MADYLSTLKAERQRLSQEYASAPARSERRTLAASRLRDVTARLLRAELLAASAARRRSRRLADDTAPTLFSATA